MILSSLSLGRDDKLGVWQHWLPRCQWLIARFVPPDKLVNADCTACLSLTVTDGWQS